MKKLLLLSIIMVFNVYLFSAFDLSDLNARGESVGGAISTIVVDESATTGNPALLSSMDKMKFSITGVPIGLGSFENSMINNFLIQGVYPIKGLGAVGLSANVLMVTADNINLYNEYVISIGYGYTVLPNVQVGATFKLQKWGLGSDVTGVDDKVKNGTMTYNAEIGVIYKPQQDILISLVGNNLIGMRIDSGTGGNTADAKDSVPRTAKLGIGYISDLIRAGLDTEYVIDTSEINIYIGAEKFLMNDMIRVAGGVKLLNISDGITPTLGFGMKYSMFVFDYAFSYPLNVSTFGDHKLSVSVVF